MAQRGNNFETYIGPVARMGAFLAFEPDASVTFRAAKGSEFPDRGWRASDNVMVATLIRPQFPDQTIEGVVEIKGNRSDDFEAAKTKAMGRALKLVGVPSQTDQFKLWAEVNIAMFGRAAPAAGLGQMLQTEVVGSEIEDDDDVEAADAAAAERAEAASLMNSIPGPQRQAFTAALKALEPPIANPLRPEGRLDEVKRVAQRFMAEEEPF